ncbi:lipopolysaccharide/colanic/teichoic acid biosynthesis glycosyltransferase [Roseovarius halotolerans]|uniref:Putative sugar transferase EpsL n=1 Tax=Roseovarius halotolerans TaxID=505353 RepID=A0A1X6Z2R8_9RHOB|nr:sugar transferase [Roseovarius halotolerans]RKT32353.1 lipopolysaccharide/colanic/teichoic acid biosynthesis glycosyltransferase [Roseovarius halotolerans]SLN38363.1 putative sugar transferase EpsL [Roseovarius halotolerans]
MTIQEKNFSTDLSVIRIRPRIAGSQKGQSNLYRRFLKSALDIAFVIAAAPIVVPFVAILALAISLDGRNPFYKQARIGKDGRLFYMWKLRSMVHDADARLNAHLEADAEARAEWDHKQKLTEDPRVTRLGRLLRKTSLDELPQLWNVFVGDMSLVGPRPMMPDQKALYPGVAYYAMRPGITGYWQISDRNQSTFAARADFDDRYFEDVSLGTDMSVLASTVAVVLRGTGC